ncbi:hypothetical protein HPB48_015417 [Haemaphysalis longicornis]|uniref:Uncharacterized protein n=1 Tax=Haemaphysalis longicornis TaxID=44386 RepID=A0A9J6GRJ5_HAELO|nr:hypothetical protein HPB48_015417 [Haemaphysalis longicornis]
MDLLGIVIEHDQCCLDAPKKEPALLIHTTHLTTEESVLEMFKQNKTRHFSALKVKKMLHNGVDLPLLSTESEPSTSSHNDALEPATPDNIVNLFTVTLLHNELSALF